MCTEWRPLITVIIPIYNVKEYLPQCIASVCGQTYKELQIILVDDGSTDGSPLICDAFSKRDQRIEVIHKMNGGLVSARKAGVQRAKGEYISFVDGDDWIDEDTYEKIIRLANGEKADVFAYGCIEEYPHYQNIKKNAVAEGMYRGKELEQIKERIIMGDYFFEWTFLPHLCDKLIRRQLLAEWIGRIPDTVSYAEDAVCTFPCMFRADSIMSLDVWPYHYRQREGSIAKNGQELEKDRFKEIYRLLQEASASIKGMERQLRYYMFFLLCLKGYSKIGGECVLFPYEKVKSGDRVFLYGAGAFGRVLKNYMEKRKDIFCCGWTDKRAEGYIEQGIPLDRYETVFEADYNRVAIAILNEEIGRAVKQELVGKGIAPEKIDFVRREVIGQAALPQWFTE